MLGSHSPQHPIAWPATEQPPMDVELTQDRQPTLCALSSNLPSPLSSPELLQPHQSMRGEKYLKILRVSQADRPQQSPPSFQLNLSEFSFNGVLSKEGTRHQGDRAPHLQLIFLLCHIHRSIKISCFSIKQPKVVQIFRIQPE